MNRVEEILRKIRKIDILTRKLVSQSFLGSYHSHFRGLGIEFSEVADYHYGDDIRTIDWNVTARSNGPYVKKYMEERELSLNLIIDISRSSFYGSGDLSRRELAAETAGVISYSAISNNDRVGLILVTDQVEHYLPPAKGYEHLFRIIRDILYFEPSGRKTDLNAGLDFLCSVHNRRQTAFLLSDFFGFSPDRKWKTSTARHELIPVILEDIREAELAPEGLIEVEDLETGEISLLNLRKISTVWKQNFIRDQKKLMESFRRAGQGFVRISSSEQIVPGLQGYFERKK